MPYTLQQECEYRDLYEHQIDALTDSQAVRDLALAIVIACDTELDTTVRSVPGSLADRLFLKMYALRKSESLNNNTPWLTTMNLGPLVTLYEDGYVQRKGDPEPKWHEDLAKRNTAEYWDSMKEL